MSLNEKTIKEMLRFLMDKDGGKELLNYICRHATAKELYGNEEDFIFRNAVLQATEILPDDFRIQAWYNWFLTQSKIGGCPIRTAYISSYTALIDDIRFRNEYCRRRQTGYSLLRNMDIPEYNNSSRHLKWIKKSAAEDCVPKFGIAFSLHNGWKSPRKIVWELTQLHATKCLLWLMDEYKMFFVDFPVQEILCFACANMRDEMGKCAIEYLAEHFPEKVAGCADTFGNNPLWYLLHNDEIPWWRPDCGMVQALVKAGCNPDMPNHLALSYSKMVTYITDEQCINLEKRLEDNLNPRPKLNIFSMDPKHFFRT